NLHLQNLKVSSFMGQNGGTAVQKLQLSTLAISQIFLRLLLYFVKMMEFFLFQFELQSGTEQILQQVDKKLISIVSNTTQHNTHDVPCRMMIKIKTVHDVPFMSELSQPSSHQYVQSSTPSCGDGVFSVERLCYQISWER
ncbi:hypothetical protein H5410_009144, partial [Solanum commersonii]